MIFDADMNFIANTKYLKFW